MTRCVKYWINKMARASTTEAATGQEKFGRFYLREKLNSGGMSDIWLVADGRGKPFALAETQARAAVQLHGKAAVHARLRNSVQLTESDYIVGYVEHGKAEGTCYLVMDYVEAENLKELYARQDPLLRGKRGADSD